MVGDLAVKTCPSCGYCEHCGRGGYHTVPYIQPWYPDWTYRPYAQPYYTTTGGSVSGNTTWTLMNSGKAQ